MDNEEIQEDQTWRKFAKTERRGKITGGILLVAIGSLFLARELGAEIPVWLLTWKMLLIGIGVVIAVKHKFMHPGWIILIGIGGAFLWNDLNPEMHIRHFVWPIIVILVGMMIIFKPRRKHADVWKKWHNQHNRFHDRYKPEFFDAAKDSEEGFFESVSFLGGSKKNIISKKFRGGDIVNIFGGTHLNLSQADLEDNAVLEIIQVFGGTKLIVPSNWEIRSETSVTFCGGIEDKRPVQPNASGENSKVLILNGTTVFGGIEIKSFE